jgi:hypothetical protein
MDTSNTEWLLIRLNYSDKIRPPDGGRLSAIMTHSAVGNYSIDMWEMLFSLSAVAGFRRSLNALYLYHRMRQLKVSVREQVTCRRHHSTQRGKTLKHSCLKLLKCNFQNEMFSLCCPHETNDSTNVFELENPHPLQMELAYDRFEQPDVQLRSCCAVSARSNTHHITRFMYYVKQVIN